ncbi:reverse transcriptase domain-containing protein [Tanacetum coccineum]
MHTRASNSELVEPLSEPERTLNRRLRRRKRRVTFERKDEQPVQPRVVYLLILDINYFRPFLDILKNYNPMDDEPMWAADRIVALTPSSTITIPETANEFAIKALTDAWLRMKEMLRNCRGHNLSKGNIIKIFYHGLNEITQEVHNSAAGGIFLYKTSNQAYQLLEDKVLLKLDWAKNQKTKSSFKKIVAFADEDSSNSNTDKIMARMDAMTMKMDAQYKELQSRSNNSNSDCNDDDIPMSREDEAKFMKTFRRICFYNDYRDRDLNRDNWRSYGRHDYNRDNYRSNFDDKHYNIQRQLIDCIKAQQSTNAFVKKILANKQYARPSGSLPSSTQPNPKGSSSKPYQPPQARNEHDEEEESTPQPKSQTPKPVKKTPIPKPYKPKISYPQCLRKEKIEAQYEKFLDMIWVVQINVPLVDVLAGMPNYGKFLKELVSNKHKLEQILFAFLCNESSAMIQNKVPPKLGDLESFLIPCTFTKTFSCNALADLGASINLMPYSLYAKLSLKTLKPTKISVRLADRSFQYPIGIAENMLVKVGKFTFLVDFVILEMKEDSKVPLILGRHFLYNANAVIRVKQKQLNFRVEEDFDVLLYERSEILHSIEENILEEKLFAEFNEFMATNIEENSKYESDKEETPFEKITFNTDYKIKTSLAEPSSDLELKPLPDHLEYVFLEEPTFLPVIISS